MPAPPFQCNHLDIAQYPDASENIHATSRWCSRSCRVATVAQPLLAAYHPVEVIETLGVDTAVDSRVADGVRAAFVAQAVLNLLRRPVQFQEPLLDQGKKFRVIKFTLAAAELTPAVVFLLRPVGVVAFASAIALQFAQDGSSVALQHGGNSGGAMTLVEQGHYATPLNGRNMTVGIHFRSPAMF